MSLVDITLRHNAQRSLLLFVKFYSTNLYGGDQNQPAITYCEGCRTRAFIQCIINKFFFFFNIWAMQGRQYIQTESYDKTFSLVVGIMFILTCSL
jgi:U3 small nucleolar RNA-associated protein 20